MLLLKREDIEMLVTLDEVIELMREVFREVGNKRVVLPARTAIELNGGIDTVLFMPAAVPKMGGTGAKIVSVFPRNKERGKPVITAQVFLNNPDTGEVVALLEGTSITALRTAAVSAVATDLLARKEAERLGVFGAGVQARSHIEAIARIRRLQQVTVYSPHFEDAKRLVAELKPSQKIDCQIQAVDRPEKVVMNSDILVTATTSETPVFDGRLVQEGTHINAIGSFKPHVRELDDETMKRARIFVDSKTEAWKEAGDLIIPFQKGIITEEDVEAELGELILGRNGRRNPLDITIFKSVGLAVEDIIVAKRAFDKAVTKGMGIEVS